MATIEEGGVLTVGTNKNQRLSQAGIALTDAEKVRPPRAVAINTIDLSMESLPPRPTATTAEAPISPKKEAVTAEKEPLFVPGLLTQALRESTEIYTSAMRDAASRLGISKPVALFGATSLATGVIANMIVDPTMTSGVIGATAVLGSVGFKRNDHARAQGLIGTLFNTAHLMLIGHYTAAVSTILGGVRGLFQSMIPDSRVDARIGSALLGGAVGIGVFATCTEIFPLIRVENIPMLATTFFALGGAFTAKYSCLSRLSGLIGTASLLPYHVSRVDISMPAVCTGVGLMFAISAAICKHDLLPLLSRRKDGAT